MPFTLIEGTFHLVGQTASGNPSGFEPDGDSMQFKPKTPALLDRLDRVGAGVRLTAIGSTQLRFEGIDALELHFDGTHQPRPLADEARDFLTGRLGMNPVPYSPPELVRVKPPVPAGKDRIPGFILSRSLEVHGRPVSFAFAGAPVAPNGTSMNLDARLLRASLNYKSIAAGQAYPLFYDTLFPDLRVVLSRAAVRARVARKGLWGSDLSQSGTMAPNRAMLETTGVIFPKLFRRLATYLKDHPEGIAGFLAWLAATKEQVLRLDTNGFTHFDNVLAIARGKIHLTIEPELLVFVSAKSSALSVAPWTRL